MNVSSTTLNTLPRASRVTMTTPSAAKDDPLARAAFWLFITLTIFTLVSMPGRIPVLGYLRPTVLLVAVITGLLLFAPGKCRSATRSQTFRLLGILFGYAIVSAPFTEWPGSVARFGIEGFLKVVVFFYFAALLIDRLQRLKVFVFVLAACQVFRVLEPLYLNITTGYWGSRAHMGGGTFMDRLSGAPADIINPNGLAHVIMVAIPLLHYALGGARGFLPKFVYAVLLVPLLYALVLTGSRSGMIGLAVVAIYIIVRSRHRIMILAVVILAGFGMGAVMGDELEDRYLSLVSADSQNAASRQGRIDGWSMELGIAMKRPAFGHGLGTSLEAIANNTGRAQISHNLYTEVLIELGLIGLAIYLAVLWSILAGVRKVRPAVRRFSVLARGLMARRSAALNRRLRYYQRCAEAVMALTVASLVFSLGSYGLSEFYWYMIAGLSVGLQNALRSDSEQLTMLLQSRERQREPQF